MGGQSTKIRSIALIIIINTCCYGIDMNNERVKSVATPIVGTDCANKQYVDDSTAAAGHNILSIAHGDANIATVSRGSLIYGNSDPNWAELLSSDIIATLSTIVGHDGTDVGHFTIPLTVPYGGTGATNLTDGGILLGSGIGAITALGVASNGQIPIGDGTTDPILATITGSSAISVTNGAGSITLDVNDAGIDHGGLSGLGDDDHTQYIKDSEFTQDSGILVGTGAGIFQEESGNTARTSLDLGTGDSPTFTALTLTGSPAALTVDSGIITTPFLIATDEFKMPDAGGGFINATVSADRIDFGVSNIFQTKNQNTLTILQVQNSTAGTASAVEIQAVGQGITGRFLALSDSYTTAGILEAGTAVLTESGGTALNVGTASNVSLSFWTNNLKRATFNNLGNLRLFQNLEVDKITTLTGPVIINDETTMTGDAGVGADGPDVLVVTGGAGANSGDGGFKGSDISFTTGPGGTDAGEGDDGGASGDYTVTTGPGGNADNIGGNSGNINFIIGAAGTGATPGTKGTINLFGTTNLGDGGTTNYSEFAADGDLIFVGTAGLPFGDIHGYDENITITISGIGEPNKAQVTIFDTDTAENNIDADQANNHIKIIKAGFYLCTVSTSIESAAGGAIQIGIGVYKNNGATLFENCHGHRDLTGGGGDTGSISISGIIDLAINDTIEVWVWNETNSNNVIVDDCTLSLIQVGGT